MQLLLANLLFNAVMGQPFNFVPNVSMSEASFALYQANTVCHFHMHEALCLNWLETSSIFEISNSLIALETGALHSSNVASRTPPDAAATAPNAPAPRCQMASLGSRKNPDAKFKKSAANDWLSRRNMAAC